MPTPRTAEQLLNAAIQRIIADARRKAVTRKTTLKMVSKKIFGDTRTLNKLITGNEEISVRRLSEASARLKEI